MQLLCTITTLFEIKKIKSSNSIGLNNCSPPKLLSYVFHPETQSKKKLKITNSKQIDFGTKNRHKSNI